MPAALSVMATGRGGERVAPSPAGINAAVGSTDSASFPAGVSVPLGVGNGRDATRPHPGSGRLSTSAGAAVIGSLMSASPGFQPTPNWPIMSWSSWTRLWQWIM
jgi:hypothetical protein